MTFSPPFKHRAALGMLCGAHARPLLGSRLRSGSARSSGPGPAAPAIRGQQRHLVSRGPALGRLQTPADAAPSPNPVSLRLGATPVPPRRPPPPPRAPGRCACLAHLRLPAAGGSLPVPTTPQHPLTSSFPSQGGPSSRKPSPSPQTPPHLPPPVPLHLLPPSRSHPGHNSHLPRRLGPGRPHSSQYPRRPTPPMAMTPVAAGYGQLKPAAKDLSPQASELGNPWKPCKAIKRLSLRPCCSSPPFCRWGNRGPGLHSSLRCPPGQLWARGLKGGVSKPRKHRSGPAEGSQPLGPCLQGWGTEQGDRPCDCPLPPTDRCHTQTAGAGAGCATGGTGTAQKAVREGVLKQ